MRIRIYKSTLPKELILVQIMKYDKVVKLHQNKEYEIHNVIKKYMPLPVSNLFWQWTVNFCINLRVFRQNNLFTFCVQ